MKHMSLYRKKMINSHYFPYFSQDPKYQNTILGKKCIFLVLLSLLMIKEYLLEIRKKPTA